jgi:hypothetical protein
MVPVSSWRSIWLYGNVAAGVIFVASVIFLILGIRKSKHQGTAAQIEVSAD